MSEENLSSDRVVLSSSIRRLNELTRQVTQHLDSAIAAFCHASDSPFRGIVESIEVRQGQRVKKGQLLLTIDAPLRREQLEDLKQKRTSIERELQQQAVHLRWQAGQQRQATCPG